MRRLPSAEPGPAFAHALAAARPAVWRVCRRFVPSDCEAEELCQEALLVAWRRRRVWTGEGSVQAWACAIGRNLGRNARRKHRELLWGAARPEPPDERPSAEALLCAREQARAVRAALGGLPADERAVLRLRYEEEWGAARIDAHLGLPGAGARAVLQRARRRLRQRLAPAGPRAASRAPGPRARAEGAPARRRAPRRD